MTSSNNQPSQNQASSPTSSSASSGIIIPCTSRQFYKDGTCFDIGPQCTQFDSSTGVCYACASGFQVYSGLCVQMPSSQDQTTNSNAPPASTSLPNCQTADPTDSTKCLTCVSGYTIVDAFPGVCYQINWLWSFYIWIFLFNKNRKYIKGLNYEKKGWKRIMAGIWNIF